MIGVDISRLLYEATDHFPPNLSLFHRFFHKKADNGRAYGSEWNLFPIFLQ